MATYPDRPDLDPATPLWRYISLGHLERTLRDGVLSLTRVDHFKDPFEGSVPAKQIDDQWVIFRGSQVTQMMMESIAAHHPGMAHPPRLTRDPGELMAIRRRAATRSAHASCWTAAQETEPRWRLYCNDDAPGQGVALLTTLEALEASVAGHDFIVSPITYRHYHDGPAFTNDLAPFLHKRMGFKDEEEVRLLSYNFEHQTKLAYALTADGTFGPIPPPPPELPAHIGRTWSAPTAIRAIMVSPYATAEYEQRVRASVAAIDPAAATLIDLSRFSERSSDPLF